VTCPVSLVVTGEERRAGVNYTSEAYLTGEINTGKVPKDSNISANL
jgi:hypothetical protein